MLAGYFVVDGVKAVTHPASLEVDAEPFATTVTNAAQRFLPETLAAKIPSDTRTLVRIHGGVEVAGAVMIASGVGRRIGAVLLGLAYLPKVLSARPRIKPLNDRVFLREVALLGGVFVVAMDTQGKPSLAWLASDRKAQFAKTSAKVIEDKKAELSQASSKFVADLGERAHEGVKATGKQARKAARALSKSAHRQADALAEALSNISQ
jgi:uncharacterized membrane protein YphA (DoxX/SURF4 family)